MLRIKRLDIFIIKSFLLLFVGTFFICLFIFMMQFLWKYVDELVGKGLEMSVLAQFFFYSALSLVPMSLPLAVLLASLITFGNFGERFELLAMKAAGISLLKIMRPLIVQMCIRDRVIAGSDRRGAAYGLFSISEMMGVSPWYWWGDVPVKTHKALYVDRCV